MNNFDKNQKWISPTICVTHRCNLNCVYCYETKKDSQNELSFEKAIQIIDDIFLSVADDVYGIEFCFIGGEPLLRFDLIKEVVEFYEKKNVKKEYIFSATTNGTILTPEMREWFKIHKNRMILCLSLDGGRECHNHNRSNSYDQIDFSFFKETYPDQGVKMTLSDYSLPHLYENIKSIHELGFQNINGVNLYEGNFDWSDEHLLYVMGSQLKLLVEYYCEHKEYNNQLFNVPIENMASKIRRKAKSCGIGSQGSSFYDTDGQRYPCVMCTPMTLDSEKLAYVKKFDFNNDTLFIDYDCNESCCIYPVCSNCAGSNFVSRSSFSKRDKTKCRLRQLIVLFNAEFQGRKIVYNPSRYSDIELYCKVEAIKLIKDQYYDDLVKYL